MRRRTRNQPQLASLRIVRPPGMATVDHVSDLVRRATGLRQLAADQEPSQDQEGPRSLGQAYIGNAGSVIPQEFFLGTLVESCLRR